MKKSRYNEEQTIGVLKRMEARQKARDLWHSSWGSARPRCTPGSPTPAARSAWRLCKLERENGELKKLVADLSLDREALKTVIRRNAWSL